MQNRIPLPELKSMNYFQRLAKLNLTTLKEKKE